jgi:hypothetical protein
MSWQGIVRKFFRIFWQFLYFDSYTLADEIIKIACLKNR